MAARVLVSSPHARKISLAENRGVDSLRGVRTSFIRTGAPPHLVQPLPVQQSETEFLSGQNHQMFGDLIGWICSGKIVPPPARPYPEQI